MPIVAPRRTMTNDVSDTAELSGGGGGGLSCSTPEFRWCWSRRPLMGTLHDGSVHVKIKRSGHWPARRSRQVGLCLMTTFGRRAGGGGGLPPSVAVCGLLPVDATNTPALSVEGPRSVPSRISVVLVDGTVAGVTRPAGMSVGGGDAGLPRAGETLSSLDVAGCARWGGAFGSECSPGRSTDEGDLSFRTFRAFGSGDDPGQ